MKTKREYLIENQIPLNHDRYKTYFTQFIVVHLGIFTALAQEGFKEMTSIFCAAGIVLSFAWLLVLLKIKSDISETWKDLEKIEAALSEEERITAIPRIDMPASRVMLFIPIIFFFVYIAMFIFRCQACSC
jgi:hypothetical protein